MVRVVKKENVKDNKDKKKLIIGMIVLVLFLTLGVAFAWFRYMQVSDDTNSLTTASIDLYLDEYDGKYISLVNTYPMTDATGSTTKAYEFTVVNNSSVGFDYDIRLVKDTKTMKEDECEDKELDASVIRYRLEKNDASLVIDNLGTKKDWVLDTSKIGAHEKKNYTLRLWIDENAGNEYQGKHFHAKLEVRAIAESK